MLAAVRRCGFHCALNMETGLALLQGAEAGHIVPIVPSDQIPWLKKVLAKRADEQKIYLNSRVGKIIGLIRGQNKERLETVLVSIIGRCGTV